MRRRHGFAAMVLAVALARSAGAVEIPTDFVDEQVGAGLVQPVNFDFLPDGRVLLVERSTARIRVVLPGLGTRAEPVGTVPDVTAAIGEQGLLGIAVDPRWPASPYVYVQFTSFSTPSVKVVRYALSGDLAFQADGALALDPLSRREVLSDLPSDHNLHNGGTLEFGPDGFLYVAVGDDGVQCAAQDPHQLRGKILRIDPTVIPDGPGPVWPYLFLAPPGNPNISDTDPRARLVWHHGLRNPWSFDFDPQSNRMAIADVGSGSWEEIDVTSFAGRDFGWPFFEGNQVMAGADCDVVGIDGLTMPVHAYPHVAGSSGQAVILGGICFPADEITQSFPSDHWGDVFFLDFHDGRLRRLEETGGAWSFAAPIPGQPDADAWGTGFEFVPRMRFAADGGLWYVRATELRRITYQGEAVGVPERQDPGLLRVAAFPNPARDAIVAEFAVPQGGAFRLEVFDARGHRVRRVADESEAGSGPIRRTWDGRSDSGERVPAGLYFLRLEAGKDRVSRRVVLLGPD